MPKSARVYRNKKTIKYSLNLLAKISQKLMGEIYPPEFLFRADKKMNPYVYSRGSKKRAAASKASLSALFQLVIGASLSPMVALAFVLFAAGAVGGMSMVAYSEMSQGEFAPLAHASHETGHVLGVATFGYTQPICGYNTANCISYQLTAFSGKGWQARIDYQLQAGVVGAIKVNTWPFMDNISGVGSGFTGYDLIPGKIYNFILYKKVGNTLVKQTAVDFTAPSAPQNTTASYGYTSPLLTLSPNTLNFYNNVNAAGNLSLSLINQSSTGISYNASANGVSLSKYSGYVAPYATEVISVYSQGYSQPGTYSASVTINGVNIPVTVVVSQPSYGYGQSGYPSSPIISLGPVNNTVTANFNQQFNFQSTDSSTQVLTFQINWGDGSGTQTVNGQATGNGSFIAGALHTWTQAGSYNVTVNAINSKNAQTSSSFQITVIALFSSAVRTGQLVNNNGTVYLVGSNTLYGIPNLDVFNSWGWSFASVLTANSAESALPVSTTWVPFKQAGCNSALDQIAGNCNVVSNSQYVTVSLNPAVVAPIKIVPNTAGAKIASFQIGASPAVGATINSITISATRNDIGNSFQNLYLLVNGTRFGNVYGFASNGTYVFNGTNGPLVVSAGGVVTVDVYIDVSALVSSYNASINNQNLVSLTALSGILTGTSNAIGSITPVAGQTLVVSGGTTSGSAPTITGAQGYSATTGYATNLSSNQYLVLYGSFAGKNSAGGNQDSVTVGGISQSIAYDSATQINVQLGSLSGSNAVILVSNANGTSNSYQMPVATTSAPTTTPVSLNNITGVQGYDSTTGVYTNSVTPGKYMVLYGSFAGNNQDQVLINSSSQNTVTYDSKTQINISLNANIPYSNSGNAVQVTNVNGISNTYNFSTNSNTTQNPSVNYDLNGDGQVNVADFQKMVNAVMGTDTSCGLKCDLNGDGQVNVADMQKMTNYFLSNGISTQVTYASPYDVNSDGQVNVADFQKLYNAVMGTDTSCGIKCDVNGDGQVNVADLQKLINYLIGGTTAQATLKITGAQGYSSSGYANSITSNQYLILYGTFAGSGDTVTVNGTAQTVTYDSATQMNVQLGTLTGTSASIVVTNSSSASSPFTVSINNPQVSTQPVISSSPSSLSFALQTNQYTATQNLSFNSNGSSLTDFNVQVRTSDGGSWLKYSGQTTGSISSSYPVNAQVFVNATGFTANVYTGSIVVSGSSFQTITIPVTMTVSGNTVGPVAPKITGAQGYNSGSYTSNIYSGGYLVIYGTFAGTGDSVTVNGVSQTVSYDSATQLNVQLGNLSGTTGAIVVTNAGGSANYSVVIATPPGGAPATSTNNTNAINKPKISGVQGYNSAGYTTTISSNGYLIIYGTFAGTGDTVTVNGTAQTVTYDSATQMNVQLGTIASGSASVVVSNSNGSSDPSSITAQ